jgi:hypothetical protein
MKIDKLNGIISTIHFSVEKTNEEYRTQMGMLFDMAAYQSNKAPEYRNVVYDEALLIFNNFVDALDYISNLFRALYQLRQTCDWNLSIKAGVCSGEFYLSDDQIYGEGVNLSTAVCYQARKDEILFCCEDSKMIEDYLACQSDLDHSVRDADECYYSISFVDSDLTQNHLRRSNFQLHYKDQVFSHPINRRKKILIGRSDNVDFPIHDDRISRKHATIIISSEYIEIIDHSSNGTYVLSDGQQMYLKQESTKLKDHGIIAFSEPPQSWDMECMDQTNVMYFEIDQDIEDQLEVA